MLSWLFIFGLLVVVVLVVLVTVFVRQDITGNSCAMGALYFILARLSNSDRRQELRIVREYLKTLAEKRAVSGPVLDVQGGDQTAKTGKLSIRSK